ncbi:MAG: hypothetical protein FJ100_09400 [Deltaproteobacteria bacterium]|nr:hypothetical protein [Deltaproteobacteria bacterium]
MGAQSPTLASGADPANPKVAGAPLPAMAHDHTPASDRNPPPDSRKFVHGSGYFVSVALGLVLVGAVLWRGAGADRASPSSMPASDDGRPAAATESTMDAVGGLFEDATATD